MNSYFNVHRQENKRNQKGGVLILVAICLVLFVSFAALTIDIGYLFVGRNELQNAADAAALGGARKLGNIYQKMAEAGQSLAGYNVNDSGDKAVIIAVAKEVAAQNKAANEGIIIDETKGDIQIGVWNSALEPSFTETDDSPFAVRVTARRDTDNASGQIATFFASIFGIDSAPVSARATASLSGKSNAVVGELELPIGVSRKWFNDPLNPDYCGDIIKFSPSTDPEACAGWTTFDYDPANDVKIRNILLPEDDSKHLVSPENGVHDNFEFINGDLSEGSFENLLAEYQKKGVDVDKVHDPAEYDSFPDNYDFPEPILDEFGDQISSPVPLCSYNSAIIDCKPGDEYVDEDNPGLQLRYPSENKGCQGASGCDGDPRNAHEWETTIVVYDSDDCTPSGTMPIKGYVDVVVFNVGYPSYKVVQARIKCDIVDSEDTRGGGSDFGLKGSIPNLVE